MKRTLGVKDSGHVLPGHGGMLDRFDSVMMAIPAAYIYIELLFEIKCQDHHTGCTFDKASVYLIFA